MKFLWIWLIIDLWLCDLVEAQMFILNIILISYYAAYYVKLLTD